MLTYHSHPVLCVCRFKAVIQQADRRSSVNFNHLWVSIRLAFAVCCTPLALVGCNLLAFQQTRHVESVAGHSDQQFSLANHCMVKDSERIKKGKRKSKRMMQSRQHTRGSFDFSHILNFPMWKNILVAVLNKKTESVSDGSLHLQS